MQVEELKKGDSSEILKEINSKIDFLSTALPFGLLYVMADDVYKGFFRDLILTMSAEIDELIKDMFSKEHLKQIKPILESLLHQRTCWRDRKSS